jgi:hypothetical protein
MDKDMVLQLLDRPIAFHRCFVPVAESVAGAVWLSQLVYWSGRGQDKAGWIYKTQQEWKEETGLGRSEQENVRKKLRNKMVLEEKEDGLPCRLFYRLNLDRLFELISSQARADAGADQYAGIQHTRMRKTSKQACGNLANKDDGNQQANTETTHRSHHKPPPLAPESEVCSVPATASGSGGVFDGLIIEQSITPYIYQLLDVLQQVGITDAAHAQDLLDELVGAIDSGNQGERQKVGYPVAWLQKIAAGELKRARCFEVQSRRQSAKVREQQIASSSKLVVDPASKAKGEEIVAQVRKRMSMQSENKKQF